MPLGWYACTNEKLRSLLAPDPDDPERSSAFKEPLTDYALTNADEAFAEAFTVYTLKGAKSLEPAWRDALERAIRSAGGEMRKAAGPFIGPKGGKWADAAHTIPWKEADQLSGFHEIDHATAVQTIKARIPQRILDGWLRGADRTYKKHFAEAIAGNESVHNATLNILHQQYQTWSGTSVPFADFLRTPIKLYRAGKTPAGEHFSSFTYDRTIAEKFADQYGEAVQTIEVMPKDTYGMINDTAEGEVAVPTKTDASDLFKLGSNVVVNGKTYEVAERVGRRVTVRGQDGKLLAPMDEARLAQLAKTEKSMRKSDDHKYTHREPDGRGGYHYYYDDPKTGARRKLDRTPKHVQFDSKSDDPERWANRDREWAEKTRHVVRDQEKHDGFSIWTENEYRGDTKLIAVADDGTVVGSLFYSPDGDRLLGAVEVRPSARRRGIAGKLYSYGARRSGMKFEPETSPKHPHTPYAAAFWEDARRRGADFVKTEKSMRIISIQDAIRKARKCPTIKSPSNDPALILAASRYVVKSGEHADHKYLERHPDGKGGWHYVYGMQNRPIGSFTVPKGYTSTAAHPAFRHGTVTYDNPLSPDEQRSFELKPIASAEGRKKVIAHGIESLAEYRDEYAELLEEPDGRRMIEPAIRQAFDSLGAHIENHDAAITEVIDSLTAPLEKARKLHRRRDFRGLQISVENQAGSIRHWGNAHASGQTKMKCDYGYIRRTKGVDGDHVDVYVGPYKLAPNVYVIDQLKPPEFVETDEQKVMLGFLTLGDAVAAYQAHYDDPRFLGQVRVLPFGDFRSVRARLSKSWRNGQKRLRRATLQPFAGAARLRGRLRDCAD